MEVFRFQEAAEPEYYGFMPQQEAPTNVIYNFENPSTRAAINEASAYSRAFPSVYEAEMQDDYRCTRKTTVFVQPCSLRQQNFIINELKSCLHKPPLVRDLTQLMNEIIASDADQLRYPVDRRKAGLISWFWKNWEKAAPYLETKYNVGLSKDVSNI